MSPSPSPLRRPGVGRLFIGLIVLALATALASPAMAGDTNVSSSAAGAQLVGCEDRMEVDFQGTVRTQGGWDLLAGFEPGEVLLADDPKSVATSVRSSALGLGVAAYPGVPEYPHRDNLPALDAAPDVTACSSNGTEVNGTSEDWKVVTLTNNSTRCRMNGSYFVVQNSSFSEKLILDGPGPFAVRASTFANGPTKGGGAISLHSGDTVLIEGNTITDWGPVPMVMDQQGISLANSSTGIWILSNRIDRVAGDSIHGCHTCVNAPGHTGPRDFYIAGNEMHESQENAIDLKEFRGRAVIVCNSMSGYLPSPTSNGEAVRINDEGQQGEVWMSKNEYSDNRTDIAPYSSDALGYYLDEIGVENFNDFNSNTQAYESGAAAQPYYDLYQQQYGLNLGAACPSTSDAIFFDDFESGNANVWRTISN